MSPLPYTEDTLVQQTTADYLEQQLGWESVYAYNNEDFGPDSLLGRTSDQEVVLTRPLRQKLAELNRDPKFRETFNMLFAEQYLAGRLPGSEFHAKTRYRFVKRRYPNHVKMVEFFVSKEFESFKDGKLSVISTKAPKNNKAKPEVI